jgi:aryl-alcohol dehydrogenase-like predicted oxidoreductase
MLQKGLELRRLGRTGAQVTFVGFGALEIGRNWGFGDAKATQRPDDDTTISVLNGVLDLGINLIDTASAYHQSEHRIGKGISQRRAEFFLASKCGEHNQEPSTYYDFSYAAVKASIEHSLQRMQVRQIDLMQIHFGPNPAQVLADGETLRAMQAAQVEGKIRFLGASAAGEITRFCIETGNIDVLQLEYNLLNQQDADLIALCQQRGIGVLIRGGVARGLLTPKVIPWLETLSPVLKPKLKAVLNFLNNDGERLMTLALSFLHQNAGISSILVGSKNLQHLQQNLALLETPIDPDVLSHVLAILA